jgi:hypothetical protein
VINSKEFQADQEKFAAQHVELYMRSLGRDSRAGELAFNQEKANSIALSNSIATPASTATPTLRAASNNASMFSRPPTSTHRGIGFVKMPSSCGTTSSSTVDREITARCNFFFLQVFPYRSIPHSL